MQPPPAPTPPHTRPRFVIPAKAGIHPYPYNQPHTAAGPIPVYAYSSARIIPAPHPSFPRKRESTPHNPHNPVEHTAANLRTSAGSGIGIKDMQAVASVGVDSRFRGNDE